MTNEDPLARRAAQVEADGAQTYGKEHFESAVRNLSRKMQNGELTPTELQSKLSKQGAAGDVFYSGIGGFSDGDKDGEAAWSAWRATLRDRKRWRDRTGK